METPCSNHYSLPIYFVYCLSLPWRREIYMLHKGKDFFFILIPAKFAAPRIVPGTEMGHHQYLLNEWMSLTAQCWPVEGKGKMWFSVCIIKEKIHYHRGWAESNHDKCFWTEGDQRTVGEAECVLCLLPLQSMFPPHGCCHTTNFRHWWRHLGSLILEHSCSGFCSPWICCLFGLLVLESELQEVV